MALGRCRLTQLLRWGCRCRGCSGDGLLQHWRFDVPQCILCDGLAGLHQRMMDMRPGTANDAKPHLHVEWKTSCVLQSDLQLALRRDLALRQDTKQFDMAGARLIRDALHWALTLSVLNTMIWLRRHISCSGVKTLLPWLIVPSLLQATWWRVSWSPR